MKYKLIILGLFVLSACTKSNTSNNTPDSSSDSVSHLIEISDQSLGTSGLDASGVNTNQLDFGITNNVTRDASIVVTVKNISSSPKTIVAAIDSIPGFSIKLNRCTTELAVNKTCQITLAFNNRGLYNQITYAGFTINSEVIQLKASVESLPDPDASGAVANLDISVNPPFLPVTSSPYRVVTVKNTGPGTAKNIAVTIPTGYLISVNRCSSVLKVNASCNITLTYDYRKLAAPPAAADLSIVADNADSKGINLTTGVAAGGATEVTVLNFVESPPPSGCYLSPTQDTNPQFLFSINTTSGYISELDLDQPRSIGNVTNGFSNPAFSSTCSGLVLLSSSGSGANRTCTGKFADGSTVFSIKRMSPSFACSGSTSIAPKSNVINNNISDMVADSNGVVYFSAVSAQNPTEDVALWKLNPGTTTPVEYITLHNSVFPHSLTAIGNKVYFTATDAEGYGQIWVTSHPAGPIVTQLASGFPLIFEGGDLFVVNNKIVFSSLETHSSNDGNIFQLTDNGNDNYSVSPIYSTRYRLGTSVPEPTQLKGISETKNFTYIPVESSDLTSSDILKISRTGVVTKMSDTYADLVGVTNFGSSIKVVDFDNDKIAIGVRHNNNSSSSNILVISPAQVFSVSSPSSDVTLGWPLYSFNQQLYAFGSHEDYSQDILKINPVTGVVSTILSNNTDGGLTSFGLVNGKMFLGSIGAGTIFVLDPSTQQSTPLVDENSNPYFLVNYGYYDRGISTFDNSGTKIYTPAKNSDGKQGILVTNGSVSGTHMLKDKNDEMIDIGDVGGEGMLIKTGNRIVTIKGDSSNSVNYLVIIDNPK